MRRLLSVLLLIFLVSGSLLYAEDPADIYEKAENRYKKGNYELALKLYGDLIKEFPLSRYVPESAFRIAVIQVYTGDFSGAEKSFEEIEKRYGYGGFSSDILFWKGVVYYRKGLLDEAVKQFEKYLETGKTGYFRDAVYYKARSEYELSRISEAAETLSVFRGDVSSLIKNHSLFSFYVYILEQDKRYREVISLVKDLPVENWKPEYRDRLKLSLAESLYKTDRIEDAKVLYNSIITSSPEIASVGLIRLFTIYKNNVEKQKEILSKAQLVLSGYPDLINTFYIHIGIESYKRGEPDIAGSYLRRVWKSGDKKSVNYLVPLYLALIEGAKGNYTSGEEYISGYIEESGIRNVELLYTLSDICLKEKKWDCAGKFLSEILTAYPETPLYSRVSWMYAYSLYMQEQYNKALAVVDSVFSSGKGGNLLDSFIRLKIKIFMKTGKREEAVSLLEEYIPLHPDNLNAELDYIILSFQLADYNKLLDMYGRMKESSDSVIRGNTRAFILSSYVAGITLIGQNKGKEGISLLKSIDRKYLIENGLESIYPYIAYYTGWAYYSASEYTEAARWFSEVTENYKGSSLYADSQYLAGWSYYLMGEYGKASGFFAGYSKAADNENSGKGAFYYGKSMLAGGYPEKAELIFQNIYTSTPKDSYADDALYKHAQILEQLGQTDEAVDLYKRLFENYPRSLLAEEGMYKIGELYFKKGMYREARKSFLDYRSRYPYGRLADASLYWGGICALKMGEKYGALLLWEKLINSYKDSSFRSEVLRNAASIYSKEGEYRKALEYYSEYMISYPDESEAAEVTREIEKLKLLASGTGEREAALLVTIKNRTLETKEGREAAIELAGLYLYSGSDKLDDALDYLKKISSMKDADPDTAGRAQYYIGEYFRKKQLYPEAVKAFVAAASINPSDRDLAAISLYKAAENAVLAGDRATAEKMINLLVVKFPSSQWAVEGRKLLKGLSR